MYRYEQDLSKNILLNCKKKCYDIKLKKRFGNMYENINKVLVKDYHLIISMI